MCIRDRNKWAGRCDGCGDWNTIHESKALSNGPQKVSIGIEKGEKILLTDLSPSCTNLSYSKSGIAEFDRVLGKGLVSSAAILLSGDPGIGKSTILLQAAARFGQAGLKVLYISGEEAASQVKLRAKRLGLSTAPIRLGSETNLRNILTTFEDEKPNLVIIDSIQTIWADTVDSAPGSVSQVRSAAFELTNYAKRTGAAVIMVGHVTKDGQIAGPRVVEHMVDTVLNFEGDRNHLHRILRVHKNRFGTTSELGIYEMNQSGLKAVKNPSSFLISKYVSDLSGHSICATIEGIRPMLIEVQALVSSAVYGTPQRSSTGFENKRLNMLLAILEKRAGFQLGAKDVFLNLAGGIRLDDPGIDLAVIVAILSSSLDISVPRGYIFAAEIGLSGELRNVPKIEQRIQEASKQGFEKMVVAKTVKPVTNKIQLVQLSSVKELVQHLF